MRTSKFTVEQISATLRRAEGGTPVAEICGELGITETTFYRWKRKYHGISTPELRELRTKNGTEQVVLRGKLVRRLGIEPRTY